MSPLVFDWFEYSSRDHTAAMPLAAGHCHNLNVLTQPAIRWLMVLEGINDLGGGKTSSEELVVAYEQIILRAHERGLRVWGGTIMPCGGSFYFNPESEKKRQALNHWIRTSGAFDAVIDWDAVTRDPADPTREEAGDD